uniref:HTH gntR-type domain-containing protein n=1 Tax=uncultured bacterium 1114 TaxID=548901 RepID=B8R930_9BACT|nr:hypothetical protein [uncultured bacterium 1114]
MTAPDGDVSWTAEPVRREPASQQIYDQLRTAILEKRLIPGEHLTEAQLARQFGVSTTPIREALQRLVHAGLADRDTARGVRVHRLTSREIRDYYEMRLALEPFALEQVAPKLTAADIEELSQFVDDAEGAIAARDLRAVLKFGRRYQTKLIAGADNRLLLTWLETLQDRRMLISEMLGEAGYDGRRDWQERRRITAALRARRTEEAARLLATHIKRVMGVVLATLERSHADNQQGGS